MTTPIEQEAAVVEAARALYRARVACRLAWGQASATRKEFHRQELARARDARAAAGRALDEAITALGEAEAEAVDA